MALTDHALNFILNTTWDALPAAVQHQARRCLLDLLGCTLAGTQTPVARLMGDFAASHFGGDEATILVDGRRVSLVGAALANGFAANALDIDDGYRPIKGHPGVCVFPALLAASEHRAVPGQEFLTALVVGYEIGIRAGMIRHATYDVYHSSGSWGAIAAAAVVGRILNIDSQSLHEAMGAAEYHAPIAPMMKGIDRPNMGKDSTGWGGMVGMSAALMAGRGFTGITPLFDDAPDPGLMAEIGQCWRILDIYFKPYACCRWTQPAIAAALRIANQHKLVPADIAEIRVRSFEAAASLSQVHPRNTEEAQYNLSFPVAAALIDGELGPRQVLPPRLFDPDLLALADRLTVETVPAYEAAFPAKAYADVLVRARDGRALESGRAEAKWEPPDIASDDELEAKFRWLVEPVVGRERAERLVELVRSADQTDSLSEQIFSTVGGDQAYFGSEAWQKGERETEADLREDRIKQFDDLEGWLADLDRED